MILADTSVWVEYDGATDSPADRTMTGLISSGDELAVTEPVVMEVLTGARDERRERQLRSLLLRFPHLHFHATSDFEAAVRIYRRSRTAGFTPRGLIVCMIAAVAWRHDATIFTVDADLTRIAGLMNIGLHKLDGAD